MRNSDFEYYDRTTISNHLDNAKEIYSSIHRIISNLY